jgi:prepilin-type N-terminal cleavage/methylation domain-containing protein
MRNKTSSRSGFTLVEITIVTALIGMLAALAIPNWARARTQSQKSTCINNLRQIDGAVMQWALENRAAPNATPSFTDISSYLKHSVVCPDGGTTFADSYTLNGVTNKPTCLKDPTHVLAPDTSS